MSLSNDTGWVSMKESLISQHTPKLDISLEVHVPKMEELCHVLAELCLGTSSFSSWTVPFITPPKLRVGMATASHKWQVNEVLLDPTGPLASLHKRVLDAGCQVNPEGNPVKALFVPCTEQQLVELQNLAAHGCSAWVFGWVGEVCSRCIILICPYIVLICFRRVCVFGHVWLV